MADDGSADFATEVRRTSAPDGGELPTDIERALFPRWADRDPAVAEPNYLGYMMWMLPVALIVLLLFGAAIICVFG